MNMRFESRTMMWFSVGMVLIIANLIIIGVGVRTSIKNRGKYVVHAANRTYYCNEFQVSGTTIYFRDTDKKNVCINGNYTLIYETEDKN
jgi:hypothetical protein